MFIVPFFYTSRTNGDLKMYRLTIFLSDGGKSGWKTDEEYQTAGQIETEYLNPNGIYMVDCIIENDIAWVKVDKTKTNMIDFYTYNEIVKNSTATAITECWRNFYFFRDENNDCWWSCCCKKRGTPNKNILVEDSLSTELNINGLGNSEIRFFEDILRLFNK